MQHLQSNTILQGGKYRIERVLGQGGFGITYLAVQTSLERNVAIKEFFMKDFCSRDNTMMTTGSSKIADQCRKKFVKEARNLARLSHPNIIGVIDVFEENDTVYYVMPYLTGGSLEDYVKKHGALSESEAMKYVRQIASALKYMHEEQHICHYDVKPANILLDNKGNAVLIDFGISKNYDASGHETTTTPIGMSEGYAPIEQYQQNVEEFSPVSDVYALGATLYFLLHGKRPVSAVHRASGTELPISEQLSQEIKDLINDSMKVSKRERLKSVDVFLKEVFFPEQRTNSTVESAAKDEETIIVSDKEDEVPFEILLKLAEEGDAEAQNELGDCYYFGEKIEEDIDQAVIWYMKAASQGNDDAQYSLGWCYENGEGVEKDDSSAFMWYSKSAEQGNPGAQNNLGCCYNNGIGVEEDKQKALYWFNKSAEQDYADAQYNLGRCYDDGEGVEEDKGKAFQLYKKAAEQGNIDAQFCLGYCYDKGEGIEEDKQEAYKWYKKAANQGNASARGALNNMKLEDYEEYPLINEALATCNYYSWERARDMAGTIIGGGFLCGFFIGLTLFNLKKDFTFLSFINDIPTYCVVIFFIIFNPITTIFLANIIDGYIESNQKVILDAVIDGLEIEVPYPVREEFTGRFSIL